MVFFYPMNETNVKKQQLKINDVRYLRCKETKDMSIANVYNPKNDPSIKRTRLASSFKTMIFRDFRDFRTFPNLFHFDVTNEMINAYA